MKEFINGHTKWLVPIVCTVLGLLVGALYQHAGAVISTNEMRVKLEALVVTNYADHKELRLESRDTLERILVEQQRQGIMLARMEEKFVRIDKEHTP